MQILYVYMIAYVAPKHVYTTWWRADFTVCLSICVVFEGVEQLSGLRVCPSDRIQCYCPTVEKNSVKRKRVSCLDR